MKKNKFRFLTIFLCSLFAVTSCTAPDEYLEKTGGVDNKQTTLETGSLTHPADEDAEGYYIAYKYWYSGELVTNNSRLGEIWSFDAKAGQQYAVYLYEKSNAFYVFEGDSVANFSTTYLKCCEQKYKYSYSEDLYDRPALITPKKDGKYYLKVTGSSSSTSEYSRTGKYDICVCKGRDGESFVELTLEGVAGDAWVEGELKFNIKDGWYDYENGTTSDWVDYDCYMLEVNVGDKVVLYGMDKTNSTYTAKTSFNAIYWNGTEFKSVFNEGYEYSNNNALVEGYPFTVPNDIALENGETKKHIYWYVQPDLEEGATSVTVDGENIGTYQVAAKINEEFVEIETYALLCAYQYQLIVDDVKKLAVGAVFNPFEFAGLKKWDGTFVDAGDEDLYIYWGDGFEKLTNYSYLLCTQEASHTYLQFSYPTNGVTYYYYKYLNIAGEDEHSPKINVVDSSLFCVGNFANATLTVDSVDKTSSAVWTWYNPNAERPTITNCENKGVIPCFDEGPLYIIVQDSTSGDIVYKEVTVKPVGENPYQITVVSGNVSFGNSATFALKKDGVDVTSSATWTCSDTSVDFNADTKTVQCYTAGKAFYINATYEGHTVFYYCNIEESEEYNLTFDMPLEKLSFGSNYSRINLSGTFDDAKFKSLLVKFSNAKNEFTFDMSNVTGITEITKNTDNGSSYFISCNTIINLILPDSVTSIADAAFLNCIGLVSVKLPQGVTSLGSIVFKGCTSLKNVNIPSSLTTIGYGMFQDCTSLETMEIPNTVTDLAATLMFAGCTSLTKATLPDGVTSLSHTFDGCESLTWMKLPSSVTEIGNWTFYNCSSLKTVTIPSAIETIGERAFYGCKKLTGIFKDYYSGATEAQNPYKNYLNAITIGTYAFYGCESLSSITPQKVVTIGSRAFQGTKIRELTIPDTTIYIGKYAFYNCPDLTRLFFADTTTWYRTTTDNVTSGGTKMTLSTNVTYASYFTSTSYYCAYNWYKL